MTCIGVDLSLCGTGLVSLGKGKVVDKRLIKSKPLGDLPFDELLRLKYIRTEIRDFIYAQDAKLAVIEGMAYMASKTSSLVQLAGLNYLIRDMLDDSGIPFVIVPPTTLKKFATGKGNCDKEVMMMLALRDYKFEEYDNNIVDAFFLAHLGEALLGKPINKLTVPQKEVVEVLKKQLK